MPDYYATFGERERTEEHPTFPPAHPDGWVKIINVTDLRLASRAAIDAFGFRWSVVRQANELDVKFFPRGELGVLDARTGAITPTEQEATHAG